MTKGKWYAGWLVVIIIGLFIGSWFMFTKQIEAFATNTVFVDQPYYVSFSTELKEKSLTDGSVYVVDKDGKKVEAIFMLNEARKVLTVQGLPTGEYTVHVTKAAYASRTIFKKEQSFDVKVVKQLESIASLEDLTTYFQTLLNTENYEVTEYAMEESATSNSKQDSASSEPSSSGGRHSGTNNQVEDIEEGDIVVTDGQFIYSILDNYLMITNAKDPAKMQVVKKLKLGENLYPTQLMLHGNQLIVTYYSYEEKKVANGYYDSKSIVKFAIFDVKDAKNPKLIREIGQDGSIVGIRKYGNILYMITSQTPNYWIMREKDVEVDLRPTVYDSAVSTSSQVLPLDKIRILPGSTEPNFLIVSAFDLSNAAQGKVQTESYLGSSNQLYMSTNAIYVTAPVNNEMTTTSRKMDIARWAAPQDTQIYKFTIDQTTIEMTAKTTIKGTVLNQFSMDEYDGYFRVATTEGHAWGNTPDSNNHLFILDKDLKQVGELTDLARGEKIYSARFMGDKAYVVTFKEVDPLFVIDVANPKAPKVLGELKIPGFSNYLHPIDEKHLLGIGYDTQVKMDEFSKEPRILTQGMKVSLFDVSDLANPIEQDSVIIGGRGTYSDVQYDHKALFRDVENGYYGFPITIYKDLGNDNLAYQGTGAQIYKVSVAKGIQLVGDLVEPALKGEEYENWEETVQRLLYIDEALYTVARKEIKSYELKTFKEISAVKLQ